MNKKYIFIATLSVCGVFSVKAQHQLPKMDGRLSMKVERMRQSRSAMPAETVIVRTTDAEAVARQVRADGFEARVIVPNLLTVTVTLDYLTVLSAMDSVVTLETPSQYSPMLTEARNISRVDDIHAGVELETPFTGKGVLLGVIDQGFEYRHPAFLDAEGNSRVRAVWNRSTSLDTKPLTTIPAMGDKGGYGHATHVTNIAAGRDTGNHYYGVAPEAEIIMIPSQFIDYEVLENIKYIKESAEAEGMPWVVNMSFGTQLGPHDGTAGCSQEIDALSGPGGILVGAMGNEGEKTIHASGTIAPGEVKYILCKGGDSGYLIVDFWATDNDGMEHFKVSPLTYLNYKINLQDEGFWEACAPVGRESEVREINLKNNKQHAEFSVDVESLAKVLGTSFTPTKSLVGIKIELADDETEARSFHMWTHENYGSFSSVSISGQSGKMIKPDNRYLVGEGGAGIPSSIAVSSINSCTKFTSWSDGHTYDNEGYVGSLGAVSYFSSPGPWLGEGLPKPLVAAPGAVVKSAVSKLVNGFDVKDPTLVDAITDADGNTFYYSAMQGTSMATPFVSGSICLWLQACPTLTSQDIAEIIQQTSVVDGPLSASFSSDEEGKRLAWSESAGYGRIDVYAGLKKALEKANKTGIAHVGNSQQPFTMLKSGEGWKVLMNNAEDRADISLHATDGRLIRHIHNDKINQGEEIELSFEGLAPGVYIIRMTTENADFSRRVLIR